jgi:hypothetical protein
MSTLIDLALKDASDSIGTSSSAQYQIKHYLESTLRQLQEECLTLQNVISMLNIETDVKALEKLNKAVELNRSRYTDTIKASDQLDKAIDALSRGSRWLTAVSDEVKA